MVIAVLQETVMGVMAAKLLVLLLAMNHSVLVLEERVVHIILVIALVFTGVGLTGMGETAV